MAHLLHYIFNPAGIDYSVDPRLVEVADRSYALCTEWFGEPPDEHRPYQVVKGSVSTCLRPWLSNTHLIMVRQDIELWEQQCAVVGHEMYHRVTCMCKGLRKLMWVDEMVAYRASQHILQDLGLREYAEWRQQTYYDPSRSLAIADLKRVRRKRFQGMSRRGSPGGYAEGLTVLATDLEGLVGWQALCRLVHAANWSEWLSTLAPDVRLTASQILDVPI